MEKKAFRSNCIFEVIKAKIKYGKSIKVIRIPARYGDVNCAHWMWHDLVDDNVYDFYTEAHGTKWWRYIYVKGVIRITPYSTWKEYYDKLIRV